ncbi:MAG: 3-phosphoshikimate 1-carboxyvinyltransferase [Syntrophomonadaceae bacterium]|nr:3-phosphoshikimate 1-carboxyvinyltransferase [Syntrophomonadaceae bacterium]MDD4548597.1 3-phosphoshikimate 1-carboxyvinyltransferase [Syntrophomonadaceae bacterium]
MERVIQKSAPLKGELNVAADKSISHRAVILSSLATGQSVIRNFLQSQDTISTCNCMRQLGINIQDRDNVLTIDGKGLNGLQEPEGILNCGNSGTTIRLLTGLMAPQPFMSVLSGDDSLNKRPMKRVVEPLETMGALLNGRNNGTYPPLIISGGRLQGIDYQLPIASAQVKSALLLAGLYAESETVLTESFKTRDHTEKMLAAMGADIKEDNLTVTLTSGRELSSQEFVVPGDISSAAFFLVAGTIIPGSELLLKDIGVNPTRSGIIDILNEMGARIKIENQRLVGGELVADLIVSSAHLKGINIDGEIIPRLIDELPVLAVAMAAAEGESTVHGAAELRVKETDRINAICSELAKMGTSINEMEDGFIINGSSPLKGNSVDSHGDHRIAMSLAIAGMLASGETHINNAGAVNISFPGFWNMMNQLAK